jgi:hypothetical protein
MICCQVQLKCILLMPATFGGSPKGKLIAFYWNFNVLTLDINFNVQTSLGLVYRDSSGCPVQI